MKRIADKGTITKMEGAAGAHGVILVASVSVFRETYGVLGLLEKHLSALRNIHIFDFHAFNFPCHYFARL